MINRGTFKERPPSCTCWQILNSNHTAIMLAGNKLLICTQFKQHSSPCYPMPGSLPDMCMRALIYLTVLDNLAFQQGREVMETVWTGKGGLYYPFSSLWPGKPKLPQNPLNWTAWDMTVVLRELLIGPRWEVCSWSQTVADPVRLHASYCTPSTTSSF